MLSWRMIALAVCTWFAVVTPVAAQEPRRSCGAVGVASYAIAVGETVDCSTGTTTTQRAEFDARAGEFYGVVLKRVAGTGTPCITVENAANGSALFSRVCSTAVAVPSGARAAIAIPSTGRYRAVVSENGTTFQPFQYHLTVERMAPPSDTAQLILPNQTIRSSINPSGDRDLYQVRVGPGDRYGFILRRLAGSAEPTMMHVDSLGAVRTIGSVSPSGLNSIVATSATTVGLWVMDSGDNEVFEYEIQFICQGPNCPQPIPVVRSSFNGANGNGGLCPGSWAIIQGDYFATVSREWNRNDFSGSRMPTALEGVSATYGGRSASVYYVSPNQLNVIVPNASPGDVDLVVRTNAGSSLPLRVRISEYCPAAFQFPNDRYLIGVLSDGFFAATPTFTVPGTRQARVGDIISIYPTGLGATTPAFPEGEVNPLPLPTRTPVRVSVGGVYAEVFYAGLISPGLYQVNFRIPAVGIGEQPVRIEVGESRSPEQVSLLIGR